VALPDPKPGLVVRYDDLWSREVAAGRRGRRAPWRSVRSWAGL